MEISNGVFVESDDGGYPFADLSRLRTDAGAFMNRVLSEDEQDDEMQDEPQHVITPDYPWYTSNQAPVPPNSDWHCQPIALQPLQLQPSVLHSTKVTIDTDNPSHQNAFGSHQTKAQATTAHNSLCQARIHQTSHQAQSFLSMATTKATVVPSAPRQRQSHVKKSRSIQIKRSRRGSSDEFASSSVSASAEQMYDWATWRMYHRITSARRNKSSVAPSPEDGSNANYQDVVSNSCAFRGVPGFPQDASHVDYSGSPSPQKGNSTISQEKNDFDEGVFVMDL